MIHFFGGIHQQPHVTCHHVRSHVGCCSGAGFLLLANYFFVLSSAALCCPLLPPPSVKRKQQSVCVESANSVDMHSWTRARTLLGIVNYTLAPIIVVGFSSARHVISLASTLQCNMHTRRSSQMNGLIGDLWDEIIEMATYGPGERKILAERRKRANSKDDTQNRKEMSFADAKEDSDLDDGNEDDLTPAAFRQAAVAVLSRSKNTEPSPFDGFDGYALRDLLVAKWGAPLDIDFQRDASLSNVYCNVLPIAFGQRVKCRHETELEYLMHLQGVVEILRKYNQLEGFVLFIEQTGKAPKAGTDSVPFRLGLSDEQKRHIL